MILIARIDKARHGEGDLDGLKFRPGHPVLDALQVGPVVGRHLVHRLTDRCSMRPLPSSAESAHVELAAVIEEELPASTKVTS